MSPLQPRGQLPASRKPPQPQGPIHSSAQSLAGFRAQFGAVIGRNHPRRRSGWEQSLFADTGPFPWLLVSVQSSPSPSPFPGVPSPSQALEHQSYFHLHILASQQARQVCGREEQPLHPSKPCPPRTGSVCAAGTQGEGVLTAPFLWFISSVPLLMSVLPLHAEWLYSELHQEERTWGGFDSGVPGATKPEEHDKHGRLEGKAHDSDDRFAITCKHLLTLAS